jgi:protein-disulfide isomerase
MRRLSLLPAVVIAAAVACSNGNAADRPARATTPPTSSARAVSTPAANGTTQTATTPASDSITEAADRGRILGAESAPVWFVMVSDFQCPFCKAWHDSTFRMIRKNYVDTGKLRMAFVNFPLHANSLAAARTAMCAAAQGKFWDTHDRIFDSQNSWKNLKEPRRYLDSLAVASGANAAQLRSCEDGKHVEPLIQADQLRFQQAGVGGTPTFYVGRATMVGALPPMEFRHVIDSVLAATGKGK